MASDNTLNVTQLIRGSKLQGGLQGGRDEPGLLVPTLRVASARTVSALVCTSKD